MGLIMGMSSDGKLSKRSERFLSVATALWAGAEQLGHTGFEGG